MVNGYGGSGILFYKMLNILIEHFHIILIDVIGMGGSSRPAFNAKTPDECDEFFVESME